MVMRHRLGRARVAVPKHVRLAKCRAVLERAFGPENIAKASAGTGVVFIAGAAPAAAVNPMLGACLGFLSIAPTIGGAFGLAEIRAQRERALERDAMVKRQIKRYLHAKKIKAR